MKNSTYLSTVKLVNVTKQYLLHHERPTFIEHAVKLKKDELFTSMRSVSLNLHQGEIVGVVGANGSGKTTLLKLIAGITVPEKGKVITKGRVTSLIDLEAGFHEDLSGLENIYLNGMILGMKKKEIKLVFDDVISFAEVGKFIDAPLYTYSMGMKMRLGFSVAVHSNPDVLLLDEGMAVGDEAFQKKSMKKVLELFSKKRTVVIVSHHLKLIEKYCNRAILMENGQIIIDSKKVKSVVQSYKNRA